MTDKYTGLYDGAADAAALVINAIADEENFLLVSSQPQTELSLLQGSVSEATIMVFGSMEPPQMTVLLQVQQAKV